MVEADGLSGRPAPVIQILLLGPPEILQNKQSIAIPQSNARAFLLFLAARGSFVPEEEILALFWEGKPRTSARRRLGDTVRVLRRLLNDPEAIIVEGGAVTLNPLKFKVDLKEFQDLIDQAGAVPWQSPREIPLPQETYNLLVRATRLWRGPRLLPNIRLSKKPALLEWVMRDARKMEHLHGFILERLSDHAYAAGDLEESRQWARYALANDPLNEDLHYRVMRCMVESGRATEARQYFNYLEAVMRQELNTTPSPKLVELYRRVRAQNARSAFSTRQLNWNLRSTLRVPFIGRRDLLEKLQREMLRGGAFFIFGESGQGKTRLLQEFTSQATGSPRLLLTLCRPAENNLPFQPIIELLRNNVQADEWLALDTTWVRLLSLLLPELEMMRPDIERPPVEFAPDAPPEQARALLFEAIRQVFLLAACDGPLLFCLDDIQWIDEASLATLGYLLERPPFDRQALLIATARVEEKNPHLEHLLASLQQSRHVRQVRLSQLDLPEVSALSAYVLGNVPSEAFILKLKTDTGGNPLFLLEILRALLEGEPGFDPACPAHFPISDTLHTLIQARLHKLSAPAHQALEVAAVAGIEFDPQIIGEVLHRSESELVSLLEELEERALIEPDPSAFGEVLYRFIHSKIREVLLQEINPVQSRRLHGKVANALEKRPLYLAPAKAALLAQHFEEAGETHRAFQEWVRAGKHARQLFAIDDARQAFRNAENLIELDPTLTEQDAHSLYLDWVEMGYEIEDVAELERISEHINRLGIELSSPLLSGASLNARCQVCMVRNRFAEGLSLAERAIELLENSASVYEHMEAYNHKGVFQYMLGRTEESITSFQDALSIALDAASASYTTQAAELPLMLRARANAHYQIAIARIMQGLPEIAMTSGLRSLADFTQANRAHGMVTAYGALALAHYFQGNMHQARQDCRRGLELAERIQAGRMRSYLHTYLGMVLLALGDLDGALAHARQASELGEKYQHGEAIAGAYRVSGDTYLSLNCSKLSAEAYRNGLDIAQESFMGFDLGLRLGFAQFKSGRMEEGERNLRSAIDLARENGADLFRIYGEAYMAQAYLKQGKCKQAQELANKVLREARQRNLRLVVSMASLVLAFAASQLDDPATAEKLFRSVADDAGRLGMFWLELQALDGIEKTRPAGEPANPARRSRIQKLLSRLERNSRHEAIHAEAQAYKASFLPPQESIHSK